MPSACQPCRSTGDRRFHRARLAPSVIVRDRRCIGSESTSAARSPISRCCARTTARSAITRCRPRRATRRRRSSAGIADLIARMRSRPARSPMSATARRSRPTSSSSARARVTGLLTTKGFRDVLEIGRQTRPHLYDYTRRASRRRSSPREHRHRDRRARRCADGTVLTALDEREVERGRAQTEGGGRRVGRDVLPARLPQSRARAAARASRASA